MSNTTGTSWSDIPLDLAGSILRCLPAHVDHVRFGAVCPQWRAATRHGLLPPPLPLLLLSDARLYSLPESEPIHFSGFTGTRYTDACGDWLVFSGEDGYFLRNPLSNATMKLPPLSRVRVRLVAMEGGPVWSQAPSTAPATMKRPPKRKITFTRGGRDGGLVLKAEHGPSSEPSLTIKERPLLHVVDEPVDVATLAWLQMARSLQLEEEPKKCKLWYCSPNFIVATIKFTGGNRIAVCQPGATSWWCVWVQDICSNIVDMAFHQGKLYAINFTATLFAINVCVDQTSGDPWISQIQKVINGPCLHMPYSLGCQKMAYLVESCGMLLVVLRELHHPFIDLNDLFEDDATEHIEFEVFQADLSQSQWFKVTSIGNNEVLFLRRQCSKSVCVSHNALLGACIFFLDNDDKDCDWYGPSSSVSVYRMTDAKVSNPLPTVSWAPGIVFGTWLFPQN